MVFLMFLLSNCSNKNKEISISNIDSTLIGKTVIENQLGIKYNPPVEWLSENKGLHKTSDRKIKYGVATFAPVNFFYNAKDHSVMSVGEIVPKNSDSKIDLEKYINHSKKNFETGNIERDKFRNNHIDFIRLRIKFGVWFTYRLIFKNKNGKYIQFDYFLKSKIKKTEMPSIVSSIGTIQPL